MQSYRHKWCGTLRSPKFGRCPGKYQKTPPTRFGQSKIEVAWDSRGVEDIRRQCIHHFAWSFVNEKAVFKVVATFAHSLSKNNYGLKSAVSRSESRPKRPKTQTSAGKVLASMFWDAQGILFLDYLEKGRTINIEYYIALLVRLKEEIGKKRQHIT